MSISELCALLANGHFLGHPVYSWVYIIPDCLKNPSNEDNHRIFDTKYIYDIDMYDKQLSSLVGLEQGPDDNLVTQHSQLYQYNANA